MSGLLSNAIWTGYAVLQCLAELVNAMYDHTHWHVAAFKHRAWTALTTPFVFINLCWMHVYNHLCHRFYLGHIG